MMLDVQNVSFSYGTAKGPVLDRVTFQVKSGVTTAVLGLSGSGKTTLLNLLGLLWDRPLVDGSIAYVHEDGRRQPYLAMNGSHPAWLRHHEFGFVLQSAYMLPHFTCGQNVAMPLAMRGESPQACEKRAEEILRRADDTGQLAAKKNSLAREVSGGEQRRMAVLRAIIHDPAVVFADEPTSSLDPQNSEQMLTLLRAWKDGHLWATRRKKRALVLVSHDIDRAWEHAQEFVVLRKGRMAKGRLLTRDDVRCPEQLRRLMETESEP